MEHKREKRNEKAAIQLGLFLVAIAALWNCCGRAADEGRKKTGRKRRQQRLLAAYPMQAEPKKIALTFDDGPHPVYTKILLDGLAERGAKAGFFVTGENAKNIQS